MRKLGLGFLLTGVLGQLSALLWTYTSTGPTCENNVDNSYIQQKVTDFEHEFDDIANKVATEISTNLPDEFTPSLNTPSRHRALKAIQQLELPVARKENNFVVICPYKHKQDAARGVKVLSESHGVRGWMMAGN